MSDMQDRIDTLERISGFPVSVHSRDAVNYFTFGNEPNIKTVCTYKKARVFAEGARAGRKAAIAELFTIKTGPDGFVYGPEGEAMLLEHKTAPAKVCSVWLDGQLKKFLGKPPYDGPENTSRGDAQFLADLKQQYGNKFVKDALYRLQYS